MGLPWLNNIPLPIIVWAPVPSVSHEVGIQEPGKETCNCSIEF